MASEYERLRQKNIEDNKRVLAELGLLNPFKPLPKVIKKAPKRKRLVEPQKKEKIYIVSTPEEAENLEGYGSVQDGSRRRSSRIQGQAPLSDKEIEEQAKKWGEGDFIADEDGDGTPRRGSAIKRPMVYGAIPGVEVGTLWPMRLDCNAAGIHRPTVAGIHGGPQGAYSIVLSGGYEDNIDLGTCFTYTGEGGRDLKGTANNPKNLRTAPQSKDQKLSRGNEALVKSCDTKMAVRVIRGFKLTSPFAPEDGYRYDGLYRVEKWWYTTGIAGYGVYKFALKRLEDQAPVPWTFEGDDIKSLTGSQDSGLGSEVNSDAGSDSSSEKGEVTDTPEKKTAGKEDEDSETESKDDEKKGSSDKNKAETGDNESDTETKETIENKETEKSEMKESSEDDEKAEVDSNQDEKHDDLNRDEKHQETVEKDKNQDILGEKSENATLENDTVKEKNTNKESKPASTKKNNDSKEEKDNSTEKENKESKKSRRNSKKDGGKVKDDKTPQKNTLFKYFAKA